MNAAVLTREGTGSSKRGHCTKLRSEERAQIAKRAMEHGVPSTVSKEVSSDTTRICNNARVPYAHAQATPFITPLHYANIISWFGWKHENLHPRNIRAIR